MQISQKLEKFFATPLILLLLLMPPLTGCWDKSEPQKIVTRQIELRTPKGVVLKTQLAITPSEQTKGLSGLPSNSFQENEAMLFFNLYDQQRRFWMPDTYFDLDIFFLDKDFKILTVERNVKSHPGHTPVDDIPTTGHHFCRHVLELRADSPLAKDLKEGDRLTWISSPSPEQIEEGIRPQQ